MAQKQKIKGKILYFNLFGFYGSISGTTQVLLIALHSGLISGGAWDLMWCQGLNQIQLHARPCPTTISWPDKLLFNIVHIYKLS